ncbi:MAG: GxxExxY protein, partial [Phycisphaerae bacterium]
MLHSNITGKVIQQAFRVQNTLGCGFLEKVYENSLAFALKQAGLDVRQQVPLRVHFDGIMVGEYVADMVVERAVLLELKATADNPPIYITQVLNYLKATGLPVGLLLNFGKPKLYYRRFTLEETAADEAQ